MVKIIAEIGINHGGNINTARDLIKAAQASGCWGVKFQFRNLHTFYQNTDEVSDEMIRAEIERNYFSVTELRELNEFCKNIEIKFGISFFRLEDAEMICSNIETIDFYKIPSAECLNIPLLNFLLEQGKKVFVSTGGHVTSKVIEKLKTYKNDIVIFHCIANYPVRLGDQDLNVISSFKDSGFSNLGYSSHDDSWEVCLIAISKGAKWIERHITLDKSANGLDHNSSSTPHEFERLGLLGNNFQKILGNSEHSPNQGELVNLQNLGTSLYARKNFSQGELTKIEDYEIKAPRVGISVDDFCERFRNKPLLKEINKGQPLIESNFVDLGDTVNDSLKYFCRSVGLGLPVRLHDYESIKKKFDLGTYEFHLSFSEVLDGNLHSLLSKVEPDENISIHLPDYIPGNRLLDPISKDEYTLLKSLEIIDKTCEWSDRLEQRTEKRINIVGSFSCTHNKSRKENLDQIFDFVLSRKNIILPQWLPVYAWYFGGSAKLELFNSDQDIEYLTENNFKICLDFSHLVMSADYFSADWKDWYHRLKSLTEHVHISDANGPTSEGLMIGNGRIGNFSEILDINKNKILECWQGHINQGQGFKESLEILEKQYAQRGEAL